MSEASLDATSQRILRILERDARTDPKQIAIMLGLTADEVERRIQEAEATGALVRHKAVVNWERAGDPFVLALIEVKVSPQRETGFDAIAERIYRFPEARSVYLVSGTYDLAVQVQGRSMQEVANFVASKLAPLDGVQGTVTHFMLRRYKEDGDVLVTHETAERLAVAP
ncbi:MAG TPA: Lrp/AsnC family transcriptional regulator [Chloroflexota bacterium]|jgi:DNA-binding Lrp family transcriptional regulator|nr:Lrp/AsnC family transcriptional regulator [Chloroflexota bacterium]